MDEMKSAALRFKCTVVTITVVDGVCQSLWILQKSRFSGAPGGKALAKYLRKVMLLFSDSGSSSANGASVLKEVICLLTKYF